MQPFAPIARWGTAKFSGKLRGSSCEPREKGPLVLSMKYCLFDRDPYNGYKIAIPTQLDRISSPIYLYIPWTTKVFFISHVCLRWVYPRKSEKWPLNCLFRMVPNFCGSHNWRGIFVFFFKSLLIFFLCWRIVILGDFRNFVSFLPAFGEDDPFDPHVFKECFEIIWNHHVVNDLSSHQIPSWLGYVAENTIKLQRDYNKLDPN